MPHGRFRKSPTPWMIGTMLLAAAAARIAVGNWQITDALVPLVMLAAFPFVEWIIHVFVLHWKPRTIAGVTLDSRLARSHREHHFAPRTVSLIFIPWQTLLIVIPVLTAVALLAFPRVELGLTFLTCISVLGLGYEWTHFLIHSDYKPKTALYRSVLAQPPQPPLQERALLVHRHHRGNCRSSTGHVPRSQIRRDLPDSQEPARRSVQAVKEDRFLAPSWQ